MGSIGLFALLTVVGGSAWNYVRKAKRKKKARKNQRNAVLEGIELKDSGEEN
jgi:membrane protein implicated in regulation of membrane protease activity